MHCGTTVALFGAVVDMEWEWAHQATMSRPSLSAVVFAVNNYYRSCFSYRSVDFPPDDVVAVCMCVWFLPPSRTTRRPCQLEVLRARISELCVSRSLVAGSAWVDKALQVYQIQQLRHGVMMVGPSGVGKSTAWRTLLDAMTALDGVKGEAYVIDPKAISKEQLYGTLGTFPRHPHAPGTLPIPHEIFDVLSFFQRSHTWAGARVMILSPSFR